MCAKSPRDVSARFLFFLSIVSKILTTLQYSGSANFDVVFDDTQIKHVALNGVGQVSSFTVGMPFTTAPTKLPIETGGKSYYAGENGIANYRVGKLLFPAGRRGVNSLFMFDMNTGQWSDIEVYCKPIGVAFWYIGEIVGFCEVSYNSPTPCVPYFKLQRRSGQWMDISGRGLCSYPLSTTNLTNPVILSYASQYGYSVKLYVAERETDVLHEIDLGKQESERYNISSLGDHELKIDHIAPAVAKDGSFTGIRIETLADSSNSIYHILFSSTTQQFSQTDVQTETIAFDSYYLNYLVSFTANLRTMIVSYRNGTTRQYPLAITLDDPVQCENMVGPDSHHLVCLTENGLSPQMINTADGTNTTILVSDSPVANLGVLNENTFYLLNTHQELSLHTIANSSSVHIGTYTVRSNNNFTLMGFTSNITFNINHVTANESNSTTLDEEDSNPLNPGNQTGTTNITTESPETNTPTNGTGTTTTINTGTTEVTASTDVTTDKPEETTATSHPSDASSTKETNNTEIDIPVGRQNEGPNNQTIELSIGAWIAVCILGGVIVVLVVFIIAAVIVVRHQLCHNSKHNFEKLTLSQTTSICTEDRNSLQQYGGKDTFSQPVDKLQMTPDVPGSKPISVQRNSSPIGSTYCDNKSEQFVTCVDVDQQSTISARQCSDENTSMAPTPTLRFSPDGTDLNS